MDELINMQKQLMDYVPHVVRSHTLVKMQAGIKVIDTLLRFLNSTGHKPWRPIPLSAYTQEHLLKDLKETVGTLAFIHRTTMGADRDFSNQEHYSRQLVSAYGIIEETIEYLNSLSDGSDHAHRLEELVDILFFYLEQMVLGEFTWDEVGEEYRRKWLVNMDRYKKAKEGNYDWDLRGKKEGL